MSTKFYKYIYGRQNYNRFNRDVVVANECTLLDQAKSVAEQIQEWRQWEIEYREAKENGLPAPPQPPPLNINPGVPPPTQTQIRDCKRAYTTIYNKALMNPNSNIMSTNMRIGYWMNHQNRLPMLTTWV